MRDSGITWTQRRETTPMGIRERIRAGEKILETAGMQYAAPWLRRLVWIRFALAAVSVFAFAAAVISSI